MIIKELKEIIKNLDDNTELVIDNGFYYIQSTYVEYNKYENQLQIGIGNKK